MSLLQKSQPIKPSTEGVMQRCTSDVSSNLSQSQKELKLGTINEVERAECECCGMIEEYTVGYVKKVRDFHGGNWVCGICSADVKEQLAKDPRGDMEEALSSHMAECRKFNGTTRVNPKLSLAAAMRDIARRCRDGAEARSRSKIARSISCNPRINTGRETKGRPRKLWADIPRDGPST
ncbi:hypothetical protein EJ110_NYTH15386 [Nymphaea thermarum]|nr:hypothetical protein EJ110_NYTH15386 [Nymphaea thermarum]